MERDLTDRVTVVTGAAAGIGLATAESSCATARGWHWFDRDPRVAETAEVIGGGARAYALDVNDAVSVTKTFEAIAADFGTIHLLVNNAGIGILGPAESLAVADWDKTISVNLHGPFLRARRRSLPASAEMGPGGHHRVPSGRDRHRRLCRL